MDEFGPIFGFAPVVGVLDDGWDALGLDVLIVGDTNAFGFGSGSRFSSLLDIITLFEQPRVLIFFG